MIIQWYRRNRA